MISLFLLIIMIVVGTLVPGYLHTQTTQETAWMHHLQLATGQRTPARDGGDSTENKQGFHIRKDKLFPPQLTSDRQFSTPLSAVSALVVDVPSNEILYAKNIDEKRAIASISKLMTALVLLDSLPEWQKIIEILPEDVRVGPDYVYQGERIRLRDLWNAMIIGSSNTAAVALARSTGLGTEEFVARMNQKARAMGLLHTSFVEPTGLDFGNVSTARELAVVLRYALVKEEITQTALRKQYRFAPVSGEAARTVQSTNWLLTGGVRRMGDASAGPGKTGYNDAAGYNFALHMYKDSRAIAVIVLGSSDHFSRYTEADILASWVLSAYRWNSEKTDE